MSRICDLELTEQDILELYTIPVKYVGGVLFSNNVTDGGVLRYNKVNGKVDAILPDSALNTESDNVVKNSVVSTALDGVNEKINKVAGDVDNNKGEIDSLSGNIEDVKEEINVVKGGVASVQNELADVKNNVSTNTSNINNLSETKANNSDLNEVKNTVADIKRDYATKDFVNENGGKIDTISVDGEVQSITNKNVNISTDDLGATIRFGVDETTYVLTAELLNKKGEILNTQTIDLPMEEMVINATYNGSNLILNLKNGQSISVPLNDLIKGLIPDTITINGKRLNSNITITPDDLNVYTKEHINRLEQSIDNNIQTLTNGLQETDKKVVENTNNIDALEKSVIKFTTQTLSEEQKAQARANIGAEETGSNSGILINIGSNQYNYKDTVFPAITVKDLKSAYNYKKIPLLVVIKWTFLGTETYLEAISSDYVSNKYSIDVLMHNQYHLAYSWSSTDDDNKLINPEFPAQQEISAFKNGESGVITGSTKLGEIGANEDGTGHVNGFDSLNEDVLDIKDRMYEIVLEEGD